MAHSGAPDGPGILSIGTAMGLLQEGIDEVRTSLFHRKQRKKQRN